MKGEFKFCASFVCALFFVTTIMAQDSLQKCNTCLCGVSIDNSRYCACQVLNSKSAPRSLCSFTIPKVNGGVHCRCCLPHSAAPAGVLLKHSSVVSIDYSLDVYSISSGAGKDTSINTVRLLRHLFRYNNRR